MAHPIEISLPREIACPCVCHGGDYPCSIPGGCGLDYHRDDQVVTAATLHAYRCRRGRDCPDNELAQLPGTAATVRVGTLIDAADGLCRTCETQVCSAIAALHRDWSDLGGLIAAEGTAWSDGDIVSGTRELKIPIRVYVDGLAREIDDEVSFWAAQLATGGRNATLGTATTRFPDHQRPGVRVQRAVAALTRWEPFWDHPAAYGWFRQPVWTDQGAPALDEDGCWLTATVDALSGGLRLLGLHDRVRYLVGETDLVTAKPLPCPECGTSTLVHRHGTDVISCVRCDGRWNQAAYRMLCMLAAPRARR